jgi:hypothetical protein
MKQILLILALVGATSQAGLGQEADAWNKTAATKEIDGMRRYAWALSDAIGKTLEKSPAEKFPAVHAFMRDFRAARKAIDPNRPPREWKIIDNDKLVIRNPNYWSAFYEVTPADPLMIWFHASLFAVNGHAQQTFCIEHIGIRSPIESPLKREITRLLVSSGRLIDFGAKGVKGGIKLHDESKYGEAEKVFRDVLDTIPTHSWALYELGTTLRSRARAEKKKINGVAQPYYEQAKKSNPFMIEAYQGSFDRDALKKFQALRVKAKPSWDRFMRTASGKDDVKFLEGLSSNLQAAGLHDLALLVRQLVVARRDASYGDGDRQFIALSLKELLPEGKREAPLKGLSNEAPKLQIKQLTVDK